MTWGPDGWSRVGGGGRGEGNKGDIQGDDDNNIDDNVKTVIVLFNLETAGLSVSATILHVYASQALAPASLALKLPSHLLCFLVSHFTFHETKPLEGH